MSVQKSFIPGDVDGDYVALLRGVADAVHGGDGEVLRAVWGGQPHYRSL